MSPSSELATTRADGRHGTPWRAVGAVVVVLLALVGASLVGAALNSGPAPRPPQPLGQAGPATTAGPAVGGLSPAIPTKIAIPRIGVDASVISLGTNPDGTVEVPPLEQAQLAGWYSHGVSPGEVGNAVIVGHVDSATIGPAVFFSLGATQPGDTVAVTRADGRQVIFTIDLVASYPKTAFPSAQVYGPNERPGLRVVTCGGVFDAATGSYPDNVVVFATRTG